MRTAIWLLLALASAAACAQAPWSPGRELACGTQVACLTDAELATLVGKRLVYRHPRGFGDVVLDVRRDGTLAARNSRGSGGSGPYRFEQGVVVAQLSRWGESRFRFVRLGRDQLAVILSRYVEAVVPVAVTELPDR